MHLITEHEIQVAVMQWCHRNQDERYKEIFAIPNGGYRSKGEASRLKMEGVKKGVSDLFLPIPTKDYAGLFIELKRENGKASKEQRDFVARMNAYGYKAQICYGYEQTVQLLRVYLES